MYFQIIALFHKTGPIIFSVQCY